MPAVAPVMPTVAPRAAEDEGQEAVTPTAVAPTAIVPAVVPTVAPPGEALLGVDLEEAVFVDGARDVFADRLQSLGDGAGLLHFGIGDGSGLGAGCSEG